MVMATVEVGRLGEKASRWKTAMRDRDTGPLVIAKEVVELAADWESYRQEAGGLDCTTWLRTQAFRPGEGLAWWRTRADAAVALGEASRRYMHHDVATYIYRTVPKDKWDEVKMALMRGAKEQNGMPMKLTQARRVIGTIIKRKSVKRACVRCAELEKVLAAHGLKAPE